jgi:hypothetical protein
MRRGLTRSYRNAALNTYGLAGYWRVGEISGTAKDECGLNDGTYIAAPTLGVTGLLAGDPDRAMAALNAGYVNVPYAAVLQPGDTFTLGAWIKRADADAREHGLIGTNGAGSYELALYQNKLTLVKLGIAIISQSTATFTDTSEHFAVAVKNGAASATLYMDGIALDASWTDATVINNGAPTQLGAVPGFIFNGTIDEPAIWNRVLAAGEIACLYQIGRGF